MIAIATAPQLCEQTGLPQPTVAKILKLLAKGLRPRRRPALPRQPVTLGHAS